MIRIRAVLLTLTFALAGAVGAIADDAPQKPGAEKTAKTESTRKPAIADAVRVSTDAALASAAKQEANKGTSDKSAKGDPDDAVLEFHPAAPGATADSNAVVVNDSKESVLKNLHGEVYGAGGARGNQETGKVGTSSKGGKSSIYVETDRSHATPSH
jgi:hypothetical protein